MNQQPDQLSKLLLEADGLLLLLHKHRDETPIDAIKLLRKKLEIILALTEGLDEFDDTIENENQDSDYDSINTDNKSYSQTSGPEGTMYDLIDIYQTTKIEPTLGSDTHDADYLEQKKDNELPEQSSDIGEYIETNIEDLGQSRQKPIFMDEPEEPVFVNERTVNVQSTELKKDTVVTTESSGSANSDKAEDIPVYHRTYIINEPNVPDEEPQVRRPISSVFNLNDKFRFRRELFGNSDAQYVECLDMLAAMKSIDEAKEYLYEDLNWDPENEDAKDFIQLISNYFK